MKPLFLGMFRKTLENCCFKFADVHDLSNFNFFTRMNIRESLFFLARTSCKNTDFGVSQTVTIPDISFVCHVYVRMDGLCCILITDSEVPKRIAFSFIFTKMSDYEKSNPYWKSVENDQKSRLSLEDLKMDKLFQIEEKLNDIKEIMNKNLDEIIKRGEDLDSLVRKSQDLSDSSRDFWIKAKRTNQCCKVY